MPAKVDIAEKFILRLPQEKQRCVKKNLRESVQVTCAKSGQLGKFIEFTIWTTKVLPTMVLQQRLILFSFS